LSRPFPPFVDLSRTSRVATVDRWDISGSETDRTQVGGEIIKDKNHGAFDKISSFRKWALFDGRSPAPEFSGSGNSAKEPPFKFSFEDSFGNKGVAFITPTKTGITFSVTINEVEDPRCLIFYKGTELKRIAQSEPL
jgi:hypothetical protein